MKKFSLYTRVTPNEPMIEYISSRGGDPSLVSELFGQNLSIADQKIGYIPAQNACRGFECAAEILDDPYFGLRFGQLKQEDFRSSGPMVYLASLAVNVRDFLKTGTEYQALHTNAIHYAFEEDPENLEVTGVITFHPMSGPYRQYSECVLATLFQLAHKFIPDFEIKRVTFQHRAPDNMEWYEKAFQAPVTFNAARTTMTADIKYLNLDRSSFLNGAIQKSLKIFLNRKLKQHPHAAKTIRGSIIEVLPSLIGIKQTDVISVANSLGMHPKKMRRLLKDEDTNYTEILDEVRQFQAIRLLEDTDIPVTKIAQMLDYASGNAFNTAFKRWVGTAPLNYRKSSRFKPPLSPMKQAFQNS